MPAQGEDAATRPAHVAEQRLQDRRGADVLDADGVLGPAEAVDERGRAVAARVGGDELAHLGEQVLRHPADLLDDLRCVAGEVPLEYLEHAARMLQRLVGVRRRMSRRAARAVRLAARRPADLAQPAAIGVRQPASHAARGRNLRRPW